MKLKHLKILLIIPIVFSLSCTAYKQVPYFQDIRRDTIINEKINNYSPLTLQPGDLLGINVRSLNREADLIYNYNLLPLLKPVTGSIGATIDPIGQLTIVGYLVDHNGNINVPSLGLLNVSGLTTEEVTKQLEDKLQVYLSKPTVNVRLLNFRVSVIGDVKNPGTFSIQNEKISITEALSLAGDLNTTGLRNSVLLIREVNGKRQYVNIDLTSKKTIESPYFYLKSNDLLYVQPNKARAAITDEIATKISIIISALSVLVLVLKK